jgi:uncharacterized membrane-anchored protein YjiN (DUF445 family)
MKKKDIKELKRIHDSIPESMRKRLMKKEKVTPTISKVIKMALKDPTMPPERRKEIQDLQDTGKFDQVEEVVNKKVEKEIDAYVLEEMRKSVLAGRLTKPKNDTLLDKYIKKCKKNI